MFTKTSAAALCLAALSTTVSAYGSTTIKNQCSSPVYVWTVSNVPGNMQTLGAGQSTSQPYEINPDGGGVSIKISTSPSDSGAITQFEYTVDGMLWYDISNINGYPFMDSGLSLIPSDSGCRSVVCSAGVELCSAAYNVPDDNQATAACGVDSDTTLVLCSNESGGAASSSSSDSSSSSSSSSSTSEAANTPKVDAVVTPATTAKAAPPVTSAATVPTVSTAPNGGVATTFVTHMVTVVAAADSSDATPASDGESDWSFFHKPADLGIDWGFAPVKRGDHNMHKRAAHRHHFHRHAAAMN